MNIEQSHPVLEIEAEVEVVNQVLALRQQVWNELRRMSRARDFVVCAEIVLAVSQHLLVHIEAMLGQRVDIERLVQFHRLVNACFNDVPHWLVLRLCQPVDLACLVCTLPFEATDQHWLSHCPPEEDVPVEVYDVRRGLSLVIHVM